MQLNISQIAKKEISVFFSSPSAFLFLGTYLATTLFAFFWVETFFARNIADVIPLFEGMPILLAFLSSALTMKLWSEERRMGTLEFLLTKPVGILQLVLGKFLACLFLVTISLTLTIFIPITVSMLGNLDWGPVIGAYIATIFLAAAYISIGLTVSANSDNQIVSLIVSTLACLTLYALGSETITAFFSSSISEILKLIGSGSRFTAISRGVLDLRDIYYYLSIVAIFLSLNIYFLEKTRWSLHKKNGAKTLWRAFTLLLILNFVVSNFWLQQIRIGRLDLTQGKIYSISSPTKQYISQLEEPLLIRGYFSSKLHPLLSPLAPQLKNLLAEYEIASKGKVRIEIIDPLKSPDLELEANEKYGIKPVPFQVADKYQTALVNAYFNVVVQYGDQFEVLGFRDLIEVRAAHETDIDVTLRNPEYELTRSIKKISRMYRDGEDIFASVKTPIKFTSYISSNDKLPAELIEFKQEVSDYLYEESKGSKGKLTLLSHDPDSNNGAIAKEIEGNYGFQPMSTSLLDSNSFYYYMIMEQNDQVVQLQLPTDLSFSEFKRNFETGIKRFSTGFMKTIAFYESQEAEGQYYAGMQKNTKTFSILKQKLGQNFIVKDTDLKNGIVPDDADVLLIARPGYLSEKQLFAIDQFLMKGGSIILATSPFNVNASGQGFNAERHESNISVWLEHNGLSIADTMVLDSQNSRVAIPIERNMAGITIKDYHFAEYPYFVDVRDNGLNKNNMISSSLPQLTFSWGSPITIKNHQKNRSVVSLLKSSNMSWTSDSLDIVPDFETYGSLGVEQGNNRQEHLLGVMVEGKFASYFYEKDSPMFGPAANDDQFDKQQGELFDENLSKDKADELKPDSSEQSKSVANQQYISTITRSPESSRIILYSSNEFLTDEVIKLASVINNDLYLNSTQLVENSIDWSLEDKGLLSIRSRGHFVRTLVPMSSEIRMFWEYGNYLISAVGLMIVYLSRRYYRNKNSKRQHLILSAGG